MSWTKRVFLASIGTASLAALLVGQNPPAPTVDRVGFPTDYTKNMRILYVYDRPDNKSVRTIYANDPVFTVSTATQNDYPYGSILVMETWRSLQDSQGAPILDAGGRYQKGPAATPTLFVMRKEKGFGVDYGPNRNGEWEYVAYRPDGTYSTTPQNSFSCAVCHLQATQWRDWVFRGGLHFDSGSGANPTGTIRDYTFVPGVMHVKPNSTVTIYNDDVIAHHIADDTPTGFSMPTDLKAGSSVTLKFGTPPKRPVIPMDLPLRHSPGDERHDYRRSAVRPNGGLILLPSFRYIKVSQDSSIGVGV